MVFETLTEIKKEIKKFYGVNKITVDIQSDEDNTEYDVNVNVWYYDRWYNEGFDSFCITLDDEKKAVRRAKSIATSLSNTYKKCEYVGFANC